MSINRVCISGNLTRDPEIRSTAGGTSVMGFGVAVNERRRNAQTGEWEDYPNFVDCTLFGRRAEALERYLSKGSKVAIEGKLRWSQWIGYIFLDDFGRTKPAFLNSTGVMYPSVECILKLLYQCT